MANIWALPLALSNFNIVVTVLGGFISLFGLVSYLLKEQFYLSEALISLLFGIALGPSGANFIRPKAYVSSSCASDQECQDSLDAVTLAFSRLVLGVQLVIAGIQLPSKYLWRERRSIALLLGPGMTCMWLATSLLVWALVGTPSLLHALAVGACVTPTDPVLSAVIVHGRFADNNVPRELQDLIVAESGANDGLGYPFLFFALYLIRYKDAGFGSAGDAVGLWFASTWAYTIALSVVYGALVGWLAKELLYRARARGYVDRESFLVFAVSLALFVLGTCGLVGTDDILACFVAGNAFTWDDWFRKETKDDSLQATIDMLLNVSVFLWYGAVVPWDLFRHNAVVSTGRLVALGVAVLLLRRLPWIFGLHSWIPQIAGTRQALFVGFFGPIGVSAVFYLLVTIDFIQQHLSSDEDGRVPRSDVEHLGETVRVVVWFLTVCSIVVHGLSIPLGRMGYLTPRTIYRVMSESLSGTASPSGSRVGSRVPTISRWLSFGGSDIEAVATGASPSAPSGLPAQSPHPPAGAVLSGNQGEPASELQDSMPPRRREIRFYEDPEPRPSKP